MFSPTYYKEKLFIEFKYQSDVMNNLPIGSSYSYCRKSISGNPFTKTAKAVSETKGRKMTGVAGMTSVLSMGELTELELWDSDMIFKLNP